MKQKINDITLYATMSCPYCKMEKIWLDKKGIKHKLVFVDLNPIEAQKMVEETGQMGVPVTKITYENNAREYVVGFNTAKLESIFNHAQ